MTDIDSAPTDPHEPRHEETPAAAVGTPDTPIPLGPGTGEPAPLADPFVAAHPTAPPPWFTAEPEPEPQPEPEPEPVAEPVAGHRGDPEPVPEWAAEHSGDPEPMPEPAAERGEPEPVPDAEPPAEHIAAATPEPMPEPAAAPMAEHNGETAPEPLAESAPEPYAASASEPVAESAAEHAADVAPDPQPFAPPVPEPEGVAEAAAPVAEHSGDAAGEPTPAPPEPTPAPEPAGFLFDQDLATPAGGVPLPTVGATDWSAITEDKHSWEPARFDQETPGAPAAAEPTPDTADPLGVAPALGSVADDPYVAPALEELGQTEPPPAAAAPEPEPAFAPRTPEPHAAPPVPEPDIEPVFVAAAPIPPRPAATALASMGELSGKELSGRALTVNDQRIGKLEPGFGFSSRMRSLVVLIVITLVVAAAVAAVLAIGIELISVWANNAISKSAGN